MSVKTNVDDQEFFDDIGEKLRRVCRMATPDEQIRYVPGSEWNKAWRYCPKCGHRSLIDDKEHPLDVPRICPDCKTTMVDQKPMSEVLETKTEEAKWKPID